MADVFYNRNKNALKKPNTEFIIFFYGDFAIIYDRIKITW